MFGHLKEAVQVKISHQDEKSKDNAEMAFERVKCMGSSGKISLAIRHVTLKSYLTN